jgi:hypothetical protein
VVAGIHLGSKMTDQVLSIPANVEIYDVEIAWNTMDVE